MGRDAGIVVNATRSPDVAPKPGTDGFMTGSDERLFFWLGVVSEPARVTVRHRRETRHPRRDAIQVRRTCVACVVMVCAVDGGRGSGQRLARHTEKTKYADKA